MKKQAYLGLNLAENELGFSGFVTRVGKKHGFLGTKQCYRYFYPTTNISKTDYTSTVSSPFCL